MTILEVFKRRKDWEKLVAISCCVPAAVLFWLVTVGPIVEDKVLVVIVELLGADTTELGVVTVFVVELDDERVP